MADHAASRPAVKQLHLSCLSCRVRYLSESLDDLFREVSLLRMRITELSQRLTTLEPLLRHYGYREKAERGEAARGGGAPRHERASSAGGPGPPRGSRLVKRGPGKTQ